MIRAAARVHNTFNGSVNTAVQDAAQAALEHAEPDVERMRSAYAVRREIMRKGLQSVQGLTLSEPEGAFYFFPSYDLPIPSVDMVARLREAGIAVRPGFEFGAGGEHHLRLSYAASEDAIRTGTARLAAAFESLRSSVGVS
jgi:aspartate aminotransferase